MGLLDIGAPNSVMTLIGVTGAGATGYVLGRSGKSEFKKKWKTAEQERQELSERIGEVDIERQHRAIAKVAILRQLAWKDGKLHDVEKLFIYDYILENPDLAADTKVLVMKEIGNPPSALVDFWDTVSKRNKDIFCGKDEREGFKSVLAELAHVDGSYDKDEERYINRVLKWCGID